MINNSYFTDNYNKVIISDNTDLNREYNVVDLMMVQDLCNSYMACGYIINPKAVFDENAYEFLKKYYYHIACNYNSTFYMTWQDVLSKNRFELFLDQLCHYASTYGTNYECETDVPNKDYIKNEEIGIDFKKYKFIDICTETDAFKIALTSFDSGIALSQDNLTCLMKIIIEYANTYNVDIDSAFIENNVKNREAKVRFYDVFHVKPSNPVEILRLMIFQSTHKTDIINSKEMLSSIQYGDKVNLEEKYGDVKKELAGIYHRFHKIFLMFGHQSQSNKSFINKLSRLAKKYHKPFEAKFLEKCLDWDYAFEMGNHIQLLDNEQKENYVKELSCSLKNNPNINTFKAVKILNAIRERTVGISEYNYYRIRNGKVWLKTNKHYNDYNSYVETCECYYNIIERVMFNYILDNFIKYLKENNIKHIVMDDCLDIAAPTSEKNFLGTLPEFSTIDLSKSKNNMIGVYWRNEWGTKDFDLSCIFNDGSKIGWNADFYNSNNLISDLKHVFSGDMTNADPEATEVHFFNSKTGDYKPCVFYCNRYNGVSGSKFKLFFSQSDVIEHAFDNTYMNYSSSKHCFMVNPSDVMFETMMTSNKQQQTVGVVCDNKFCFTNMELTNSSVARTNSSMEEMILNIVGSKISSRLSMNELINYAHTKLDGTTDSFNLWIDKKPENIDENENVLDLSLKSITKDTIISIFK